MRAKGPESVNLTSKRTTASNSLYGMETMPTTITPATDTNPRDFEEQVWPINMALVILKCVAGIKPEVSVVSPQGVSPRKAIRPGESVHNVRCPNMLISEEEFQ